MPTITETCQKCSKQFLIIEKEQKFLEEKKMPLPTHCPSCRQLRRLMLRGERTLCRTTCNKCKKPIVISYNPETTINEILCREDYEKYYAENDLIIHEPLPEIS